MERAVCVRVYVCISSFQYRRKFSFCHLLLSDNAICNHFTINRPTAVIDLEAMGFGGQFPEILAKGIKSVKQDEPLLWDSLITDPIAKRAVEDPMTVVKEIINIATDAAGYSISNA